MSANNIERCVLCGKETNVSKDKHVNQRDNYVDGCGQLCIACWRELNKSIKQQPFFETVDIKNLNLDKESKPSRRAESLKKRAIKEFSKLNG